MPYDDDPAWKPAAEEEAAAPAEEEAAAPAEEAAAEEAAAE